jgi:hypothetical protein
MSMHFLALIKNSVTEYFANIKEKFDWNSGIPSFSDSLILSFLKRERDFPSVSGRSSYTG